MHVVAVTRSTVHEELVRKYASLTMRSLAKALAMRLHRRHIDVVEAHIAFPTGLIAWPIARLLGSPLVLFAHGSDVTTVPYRNRLMTALARRLYHSADLIIANSHYLKGEIERGLSVSAGRVVVISPGIDLAKFVTQPADPSERKGFLFAGRLVPQKGLETLLEALAQITPPADWEPLVTVAGGGPLRASMEERARELHVSAEFVGPQAPDGLAVLMKRAAIVVAPSVYPEGLGLVAIEAMGGLVEAVVDDKTGFLTMPGDVASLANGLRRALAAFCDSSEATRLRGAAATVARGHDVHLAVRASLDVYRGVK